MSNSRMKAQKKRETKKSQPITLQMVAARVGLTKGTCSAVLTKLLHPDLFRSTPRRESSRLLAS